MPCAFHACMSTRACTHVRRPHLQHGPTRTPAPRHESGHVRRLRPRKQRSWRARSAPPPTCSSSPAASSCMSSGPASKSSARTMGTLPWLRSCWKTARISMPKTERTRSEVGGAAGGACGRAASHARQHAQPRAACARVASDAWRTARACHVAQGLRASTHRGAPHRPAPRPAHLHPVLHSPSSPSASVVRWRLGGGSEGVVLVPPAGART